MNRIQELVRAAAAAVMVLVAGCSGAQLSAHDKTVTISEVDAFLDHWIETTDKGEFALLKPMYSERAGFRWVENGRVAYASAQDAAAALDMAATGGYTADMDLQHRDITPLSKTAAAVSADYTLAFDFGPGAQFTSQGAFTGVVVKEDDDWKFLIGHLSEPPADLRDAPPAADEAPLDAVPADDAAAADVPVTEAVIDAGPTPQE
ncbi:MAG: nuclear transport factor 2 family protein [Acidobacteria bacterium]|jgi:hypothetical protein|nr:nuclear transport factor 2 family protein [Acidobacteriota bacterium]